MLTGNLSPAVTTNFGKNDSKVSSPPLAGTRETLSGYLHFIWDIPESHVFHFNYTCHSLVPLSLTHLSIAGHLVSKVSSECFISDLSGIEGQLLQSTHYFLGCQQRLHLISRLDCIAHLLILEIKCSNTPKRCDHWQDEACGISTFTRQFKILGKGTNPKFSRP